VDVFVRADSDDPSEDRWLQIVQLPAATKRHGGHNTAIEVVISEAFIAAAAAHNWPSAARATSISCYLPVSDWCTMRDALSEVALATRFNKEGNAHLWLVDAKGPAHWRSRYEAGPCVYGTRQKSNRIEPIR
jgi:hypothetical protein